MYKFFKDIYDRYADYDIDMTMVISDVVNSLTIR